MKQSQILKDTNKKLRLDLLTEISKLVQKHIFELKLAVEFQSPIFIGTGYDEQDSPPEIEEVTDSGLVIVFYQGQEHERLRLEDLSTEKLIEVLEGVEVSFEEGEKYLKK